tara:strand:+ start:767 stop:943 length:177 start_codon:yes stop_codon:yes gene_type:complete
MLNSKGLLIIKKKSIEIKVKKNNNKTFIIGLEKKIFLKFNEYRNMSPRPIQFNGIEKN